MTPARTRALGAFLLVLPHLALGDGRARPDCHPVAGAYEYGAVAGFVAWSSRAFLPGGAKYKYQRTYYRDREMLTVSCSPDLPPGTDGRAVILSRVDGEGPPAEAPFSRPMRGSFAVYAAQDDSRERGITQPAIDQAFAHGDVQKAFEAKTPIFYGRDTRPVDGTAFEVKRTTDGRSFLIGSPCSTRPVIEQQCIEIPPGLTALRELLLKLDQQQLGHPLCQAAIRD